METWAVEAREICKRFPGVQALDHASVAVAPGSCHALMGENGAGKSTLGKILSGIYEPDSGTILLEGRPVRFANPMQASQAGVSIVHQELLFCENMTVGENLCLEDLPNRRGWVDWGEMRRRAKAWLEAIGADVDPDATVGSLPISLQQMVQIAGAIGRGAKVLIFDEPTSSLTQRETETLFDQIRRLTSQGVACIYVSHRMDEIFEICDSVTVLRDGKTVGTRPTEGLTRDELVRMMIGRNIDTASVRAIGTHPDGVLLRVQGLGSPPRFADVSFEVRAGEVVGFAGLVGAGRSEVAQAIFGLDPKATGRVWVGGTEAARRSPASMMRLGLGLVPEDRKRQGLVLGMTARENISLPSLPRLSRAGFVDRERELELARRFFDAMAVKAPHVDAPSAGLSGGNQQKLVMAKWLAADCRVLILDEPTRGVDVGTKSEIHHMIRRLAAEGRAVVVISSELPELLTVSDRILAMRNGRIAGELPADAATEEALLRLMTGVEAAVSA